MDYFMVGVFSSRYVGMISEFEISNGVITETIELEEGFYEGLGRLDLSLKMSFRF